MNYKHIRIYTLTVLYLFICLMAYSQSSYEYYISDSTESNIHLLFIKDTISFMRVYSFMKEDSFDDILGHQYIDTGKIVTRWYSYKVYDTSYYGPYLFNTIQDTIYISYHRKGANKWTKEPYYILDTNTYTIGVDPLSYIEGNPAFGLKIQYVGTKVLSIDGQKIETYLFKQSRSMVDYAWYNIVYIDTHRFFPIRFDYYSDPDFKKPNWYMEITKSIKN